MATINTLEEFVNALPDAILDIEKVASAVADSIPKGPNGPRESKLQADLRVLVLNLSIARLKFETRDGIPEVHD